MSVENIGETKARLLTLGFCFQGTWHNPLYEASRLSFMQHLLEGDEYELHELIDIGDGYLLAPGKSYTVFRIGKKKGAAASMPYWQCQTLK